MSVSTCSLSYVVPCEHLFSVSPVSQFLLQAHLLLRISRQSLSSPWKLIISQMEGLNSFKEDLYLISVDEGINSIEEIPCYKVSDKKKTETENIEQHVALHHACHSHCKGALNRS
jgi:hypothetical protein